MLMGRNPGTLGTLKRLVNGYSPSHMVPNLTDPPIYPRVSTSEVQESGGLQGSHSPC